MGYPLAATHASGTVSKPGASCYDFWFPVSCKKKIQPPLSLTHTQTHSCIPRLAIHQTEQGQNQLLTPHFKHFELDWPYIQSLLNQGWLQYKHLTASQNQSIKWCLVFFPVFHPAYCDITLVNTEDTPLWQCRIVRWHEQLFSPQLICFYFMYTHTHSHFTCQRGRCTSVKGPLKEQ